MLLIVLCEANIICIGLQRALGNAPTSFLVFAAVPYFKAAQCQKAYLIEDRKTSNDTI